MGKRGSFCSDNNPSFRSVTIKGSPLLSDIGISNPDVAHFLATFLKALEPAVVDFLCFYITFTLQFKELA